MRFFCAWVCVCVCFTCIEKKKMSAYTALGTSGPCFSSASPPRTWVSTGHRSAKMLVLVHEVSSASDSQKERRSNTWTWALNELVHLHVTEDFRAQVNGAGLQYPPFKADGKKGSTDACLMARRASFMVSKKRDTPPPISSVASSLVTSTAPQ